MSVATETKKITLADIREYFTETIYNDLPLIHRKECKEIAKFVFDKELKDETFLPGNTPAHERADFIIFENGGYYPIDTEQLIAVNDFKNRIRLLGRIIILTHRQTSHNENRQSEINLAYTTLDAEGLVLTEYEKQLIDGAATRGFWNG